MTISHQQVKQEKLNMRINHEERMLIDHAAKIKGQNRSDFILRAARREAENTILDQTIIHVTPETYALFLEKLDAPAAPNKRLIQTMQTQAPWENDK